MCMKHLLGLVGPIKLFIGIVVILTWIAAEIVVKERFFTLKYIFFKLNLIPNSLASEVMIGTLSGAHMDISLTPSCPSLIELARWGKL